MWQLHEVRFDKDKHQESHSLKKYVLKSKQMEPQSNNSCAINNLYLWPKYIPLVLIAPISTSYYRPIFTCDSLSTSNDSIEKETFPIIVLQVYKIMLIITRYNIYNLSFAFPSTRFVEYSWLQCYVWNYIVCFIR